jgi:adenylosuccinate synthase
MTNSLIGIGPGTAIDPEKLSEEIKRFKLKPDQIKIDPRCPLITPLDIKEEIQSANMRGIGSTMSGTGACMAKRVLRTAPLAGENEDLNPL